MFLGDAAIRHMLQNKDNDPYRFVHFLGLDEAGLAH